MAMEQPAQAPAQGAPQQGQADIQQFIANISEGLAMLTDTIGDVSPGAAQKINQANDLFKAGIEELMSQGKAPAGQGQVSPEAGGAAGAVPASMRGVR